MAKPKDRITVPPACHGRMPVVLLAAVLFGVLAVSAQAAEKKSIKFMGVEVEPYTGTYVVLKDVSLRDGPETKAKRLGSYKAGRRIQVVGLAPGSWVAVRDKGRDAGFVYSQVLLPLIDGSLAKNLTGHASAKGKGEPDTDCRYDISFEGKSAVEGQVFEIADYDVVWDCKRGERKIKFRTPMFITEAPYQLSSKRIFQITVDVVDLDGGYEEVFSTFLQFNMEKNLVIYDGVSLEKFGRVPATKQRPAKNVETALRAAIAIALEGWNDAVWKDLIKEMPKYPDAIPEKKE